MFNHFKKKIRGFQRADDADADAAAAAAAGDVRVQHYKYLKISFLIKYGVCNCFLFLSIAFYYSAAYFRRNFSNRENIFLAKPGF